MEYFGYRLFRNFRTLFLRVAMVLALCGLSSQSIGQILQVDRLKASYLVGFIDFARWESESASNSTTIAVLSDQDLYRELRRIARDQLSSRKLEIIHLKPGTQPPVERFDILFVEKGQDDHWEKIKGHCMEAGILLVGEVNRFMEDGRAIQFVYRKNRLRFIVNQDNANRQGIVLSSKLVELSVDKR